ncbi:MAG: chromosome segregation protein SMC [Carboxydocellales bacterium]
MHLKRLEIQGFKSFADKVDFHFNHGVTVVVGPNGSGKSNISDSIRWVLGEQSAKSLRGSKMEDIIFAGSDKRRPVGAAEVSMTIDNSDGLFPLEYSEVTVTRRVYRSGDSEFLINKVPCRLRDIHELFMDTGVGRETYSIISQGKVEQILSAKPEERRTLLEEAAGIVKYRSRKQEALRKLDDTQQNLNRVNDIITELESQLEPLAQQAERAKCYQEYHAELVGLEINLMVHQLEEQKQRLATAVALTDKLRQQVLTAETTTRLLEAQVEELRLSATKLEEAISHQQQLTFELSTGIERVEGDIKVGEERAKGLEEQVLRLEQEIQEGGKKQAELEREFALEVSMAGELTEKVAAAETQLTAKATKLAIEEAAQASGEQVLEGSKGDIIELLNQMAGIRNELAGLEGIISSAKRREQQLALKAGAERDGLEAQTARTIELQQQGETWRKELANWQQEALNNRSFREQQEQQLTRVRVELRQAQAQWQAQQSRHKVLQELHQHFEGYQRGVKEVLLAKQKGEQRCQDVCGVVAELITVPRKYELAVEVALGGTLQNLVTNSDDGATQAINYLKEHKLGRATFLPLNTIKGQSLKAEDEQALKMPGVVGLAARLVNCAERYQSIVDNLLGRIIIIDNIDHALQIARATKYRVRLVTLDGDVINPGGSLTGGSYQQRNSNLLGRTRELAELEKALVDLQSRMEQAASTEKQQLASLQTNSESWEELNLKIQQSQITLAELERDIQQSYQEQQRLERGLEVQAMEENQLAQELKQAGEQQLSLQAGLTTLEAEYAQTQLIVAAQQQELRQAGEGCRVLQAEVTHLKVSLAALRQEEQGINQGLQRYHQQKKQLQLEISQKQSAVADLLNRQAELRLEIENYRGSLVDKAVQLKEQQAALAELRAEKAELVAALQQKEKAAKTEQQLLNSIQQQLHDGEVKQARMEAEVEGALARLWEEFQLSYEQAVLEKKPLANRRGAVIRVNQLKSGITALGVINLGAIEEYARIKERYHFLSRQVEDLSHAKQSLYQVINEMNLIMTSRFAEAYQAINTSFTQVFHQLFGGGRAELILTDQENLLETGIDIIAQPPGKKPQHLSLLSGGERALTAIALLFAILKVKPSPFCVLDEIEASLDEANVRRFAEFVREFASRSQFIVVTHRKGTMEVADVLYGVTMDETGVSKVVSLKLSEPRLLQTVSG